MTNTISMMSHHIIMFHFIDFNEYFLKVRKDKQRSTKHTHKTKDRVTRTPLIPGVNSGAPGKVSSSCSTSDTRRVSLVTNNPGDK
jgi:hypothetical protein